MAEENKVKLHGMCASTYSKRVELALRVKGIPYEYMERFEQQVLAASSVQSCSQENYGTCSQCKPLAESYIILGYIDKTWKHAPRLLPDDPYERAQIRFWASFINQQLFEAVRKMLTSEGEAQVKAIEEVFEKMDVLEKGMKELISGGDSRTVGVKLMDPERYPFILSWVQKLIEQPVVKEVLPSHGKLVALLQFIKQNGPIRPSN